MATDESMTDGNVADECYNYSLVSSIHGNLPINNRKDVPLSVVKTDAGVIPDLR